MASVWDGRHGVLARNSGIQAHDVDVAESSSKKSMRRSSRIAPAMSLAAAKLAVVYILVGFERPRSALSRARACGSDGMGGAYTGFG